MFDTDEDQEFKDNVLDYICGFVVKKLKKKMNCQNCIESLFGQHKPGLISIRQMDDKARLIYPSDFVVKIVQFAEKVINVELKKIIGCKNIFLTCAI